MTLMIYYNLVQSEIKNKTDFLLTFKSIANTDMYMQEYFLIVLTAICKHLFEDYDRRVGTISLMERTRRNDFNGNHFVTLEEAAEIIINWSDNRQSFKEKTDSIELNFDLLGQEGLRKNIREIMEDIAELYRNIKNAGLEDPLCGFNTKEAYDVELAEIITLIQTRAESLQTAQNFAETSRTDQNIGPSLGMG